MEMRQLVRFKNWCDKEKRKLTLRCQTERQWVWDSAEQSKYERSVVIEETSHSHPKLRGRDGVCRPKPQTQTTNQKKPILPPAEIWPLMDDFPLGFTGLSILNLELLFLIFDQKPKTS
jgi:hypothetical protein